MGLKKATRPKLKTKRLGRKREIKMNFWHLFKNNKCRFMISTLLQDTLCDMKVNRFFDGDRYMDDELMRFIRWGLGNARSKRCGWESDGFDEWDGFNDGRRWKRIY